jgi:hypothetical protein
VGGGGELGGGGAEPGSSGEGASGSLGGESGGDGGEPGCDEPLPPPAHAPSKRWAPKAVITKANRNVQTLFKTDARGGTTLSETFGKPRAP